MPTNTSRVGGDLIRNCVTLPIGFKAGTVGDPVLRCFVALYNLRVHSEALRKLAMPLLPSSALSWLALPLYSQSAGGEPPLGPV